MLHEWFVEMFPETEAWFTARLRYTRSTAVMSMVGYVLGYVSSLNTLCHSACLFPLDTPLQEHFLTIHLKRLGDRHGENLSFEEGTGGIIHVDFNCLFDKVWIECRPKASRG